MEETITWYNHTDRHEDWHPGILSGMVYLDVDFLCKMALSKINLDSDNFVFIDILKM